MSKGAVDALRAMREAKVARNIIRAKVEGEIRRAAAEGKAVLEHRIAATADRMAKKPAKGNRRKK